MKKSAPYLIATTGFPCSGKSLIAGHLEKKLGFTRIGTDDIRENFWGIDSTGYEDHRDDTLFRDKESAVFNYLEISKIDQLLKGKNVVIDATSLYNDIRKSFFNTWYSQDENHISEISAQKFLIELNVPPEEITRRNKTKGRTNDVYKDWSPHWEDPTGEGYEIITFKNSIETDLPKIFKALDQMFGQN